MSAPDNFTLTVQETGIGRVWNFILRGPHGFLHKDTLGHACARQAVYAATRGQTRPLQFNGMEDGSEVDLACPVHKSDWTWQHHSHCHAPSVGDLLK